MLNKKLFKPDLKKDENRQDMAGREGVKAKKMLGALRYLWRSSQDGAHDSRVRDLKSFLRPSPRKAPAHAVSMLKLSILVWCWFWLAGSNCLVMFFLSIIFTKK